MYVTYIRTGTRFGLIVVRSSPLHYFMLGSSAVLLYFWKQRPEIQIAVIFIFYFFKSHIILTPWLPWCHLKTIRKSAKFEALKPFCFCFLSSFWHRHVNGSPSKRKALKTDVIGPEYILLAGAPVHHSAPQKFTGWGSEGVNCKWYCHL